MHVYVLSNILIWIFSPLHDRSRSISRVGASRRTLAVILVSPFPRVAARSACWILRLSPPRCGTCCPYSRSSLAAWREPTCKHSGWKSVTLRNASFCFGIDVCVFFTQIPDATWHTRLCATLWRHWGVCCSAGGEETLAGLQSEVKYCRAERAAPCESHTTLIMRINKSWLICLDIVLCQLNLFLS